ncbi:MAG TPA: DnaJ family domain-containing protein [Salinisphaeraceae bacterium]|nr:DnaJ family domain-containing protein [Salinisphaeraceae bacterium]
MNFLDRLAEANIQAAAEQGAFDDLPGAGAPLPPDEALQVPAELRAGYRLLKNAGFVPPEIARAREIHDLRDLLAATTAHSPQTDRATRRLRLLEASLASSRRGRGLLAQTDYAAPVHRRLAGRK